MRIFGFRMVIELRKYRDGSHDFYQGIRCYKRYIETPLGHMEHLHELRIMFCDNPKEEKYHRYSKIETLRS